MRVLFTAVPAYGHVLPLLPLARAARSDGAEVALSTHSDLAGIAGDLSFLPAGPPLAAIMAEHMRRQPAGAPPGPQSVVDLFTATRVELTFDDALEVARRFGPSLIVAERTDFVAPLVAASLGVPWVSHTITTASVPAVARGFEERLVALFTEHRLVATERLAFVDIWPAWLQPEGFAPPNDQRALRPAAHLGGRAETERPRRAAALVTLGTVVRDEALLRACVQAVLAAGLRAVVTEAPDHPALTGLSDDRIDAVGFRPLSELLPSVELVVSAGGAGTVLATLSYGLPLVLAPRIADQSLVADRVAAFGAGLVCAADDDVGAAVSAVRDDDGYRTAARDAAQRLAAMPSPDQVWSGLADTFTRRSA